MDTRDELLSDISLPTLLCQRSQRASTSCYFVVSPNRYRRWSSLENMCSKAEVTQCCNTTRLPDTRIQALVYLGRSCNLQPHLGNVCSIIKRTVMLLISVLKCGFFVLLCFLKMLLSFLATLVRCPVRCRFSCYRSLLTYFMVQSCSCTFITANPQAPRNLTITWLAADSATISWIVPDYVQVAQFEMVIRPVTMEITPFIEQTILEIGGELRSYTFQNLYPETQYEVRIRLFDDEGNASNNSEILTFRTTEDSAVRALGLRVKPGEVVVVIFILLAWMGAIALFLHKWGKIRLSTPSEPRYKHAPKNIDTIKVVKRPTDSIIYRSYTSQHSKTILARKNHEKRIIERMNTMPNIKLSEPPEKKMISRFQTLPVIEMEDSAAETSLS